jgi:fructose-1,6-bisphosphatase/inositol monophosphatase family enzyme
LGEEFGTKDLDAEFVWTIDPIDGTRSFISGIPLFGTLVGLLHRGDRGRNHGLAALNETYMAARGWGLLRWRAIARVNARA